MNNKLLTRIKNIAINYNTDPSRLNSECKVIYRNFYPSLYEIEMGISDDELIEECEIFYNNN